MCVIVAVKLDGPKGKRWVLGKNRDRNYIPDIFFRKPSKAKEGGYSVFVDKQTMWSEGVNDAGIGIVNSALMVVEDEKIANKKDKGQNVSDGGELIREALRLTDITDVVEFLVKEGLFGFTFVSNGEKLFVIENVREWIEDKTRDDDKKVVSHNMSWYELQDESITIIVRTNHGELFDQTGYLSGTTAGKSSRHRRKYVETGLKRLKLNSTADVFTALSYKKDKNPESNPLREFGKCDIFTTGQIVIDPKYHTMRYRPIKCNIKIDGKEVTPNNIKPRSTDKTTIYVIEKPEDIKENLSFRKYLDHKANRSMIMI